MLRSTHELEMNRLSQLSLEAQETLRLGYYGRIAALESHVEDLRKLVFAPVVQEIPKHQVEADSIITQNDAGPPLQSEVTEFELKERDQLFSGNWDEAVN